MYLRLSIDNENETKETIATHLKQKEINSINLFVKI